MISLGYYCFLDDSRLLRSGHVSLYKMHGNRTRSRVCYCFNGCGAGFSVGPTKRTKGGVSSNGIDRYCNSYLHGTTSIPRDTKAQTIRMSEVNSPLGCGQVIPPGNTSFTASFES